MMNLFKLVFLLKLVIVVLSFDDNGKKYETFLDKFEKHEVPYHLNERLFYELVNKSVKSKKIDTVLVSKFIEDNEQLHTGMKTFEVYRYYRVAKFDVTKEYQAVVVEKRGGSGGLDSYYYLLTYSKSGRKISKELIGKITSDCSQLNKKEGLIQSDFQISVKDSVFSSNCKDKKVDLEESNRKLFFIDFSSGEILEFKD